MGRHSGFFLGLCVVSTLLAGRFATALIRVAPLSECWVAPPTESDRALFAEANRGLRRSPANARTRTLLIPANSLIVITSLDRHGGRHTFEIRAKSAEASPDGASHRPMSPAQQPPDGASHQQVSRDQLSGACPTEGPRRFADREDEIPRCEVVRSAGHEAKTVHVRPEPAVERRFLAPRYGVSGVADSAVSARLVAADQNVAVYVDLTLPVEQQNKWLGTPSRLPLPLISELLNAVAERLGPIHDLDHDGRLAILITGLDCQEDSQSVPVLGCVRPSDFLGLATDAHSGRELTDVVYLDHCLPSGNDLTALLAHELAHASVYCRLLDRQTNRKEPLDLPEWLHEGIAHHLEFLLAEKTQVYRDRLEQFHRAPHRAPICASAVVSSRSERRGGSRAAVSRFLQFASRSEEDWPQWISEAGDVNQLLGFCLNDDLEKLLPEWSLREAIEISCSGSVSIPELSSESNSSHEIPGTAFKVLQSGSQSVHLEIECLDHSPWEVRWTTGPTNTRMTERPMSKTTE